MFMFMGWDDIDAGCFSWHTVEYYTSVPSLLFPFTSAIFSAMPFGTNVYEYLMDMFTLYRIVLAPTRKPNPIGLLFTHKNVDFCKISVTERRCAAPISKIESHISDGFCATL